MASDMYKGIGIGLLVAYFLVSPVMNLLRIGGATPYVIIGLTIYLFFIKK